MGVIELEDREEIAAFLRRNARALLSDLGVAALSNVATYTEASFVAPNLDAPPVRRPGTTR